MDQTFDDSESSCSGGRHNGTHGVNIKTLKLRCAEVEARWQSHCLSGLLTLCWGGSSEANFKLQVPINIKSNPSPTNITP